MTFPIKNQIYIIIIKFDGKELVTLENEGC